MNRLIRTLIVEDMPVQAADIAAFVGSRPELALSGVASSVEEAIDLIAVHDPDLVLLDVELRGGTGFDILDSLGHWRFKVIFLTAHETFAIRAIRAGALDYLVKPFDRDQFATALGRLADYLPATVGQTAIATEVYRQRPLQRLALREGKILHLLSPAEIYYLEATGEHTVFHLADRQIQVTQRLKEYEDLLPSSNFMRSHQSYLVNLHHVSSLDYSGHLRLRDGVRVPVSERRIQDVADRLKML
ncbi:LytR/AlgR family response regulator transcription factor [Chitinophaga barathri]|nr:LytTR family DNA-binding domain-containing protein [Chitinophaga barathri]